MHRRAALALCAILLLPGCATEVGPGSHAGEHYIVNTQRTLFYSFGPAQTTGPDFALYRGQSLIMLSYDYGYSHVILKPSGQPGYVATEDIAPAGSNPIPIPAPTPPLPSHRHSADPTDETPAPLPEFPDSKPPPDAPKFRY